MASPRVMTVDILTLFPGYFSSPMGEGILGRGVEDGRVRIRIFNLRDFAEDRHRTVDDRPFGGGAGMVLKPEPVCRALTWLKGLPGPSPRVILLTPQGAPLKQSRVKELALCHRIILICGRYEGIDERIADFFCDEQISIGDYVLSGGEPAALVFLDALIRLIPEVMGCADSGKEESFEEGLLEYPQYTRPRNFKGHGVPEILFSGDHEKIRVWRRRQALSKTIKRRPDLIEEERLSPENRKILMKLPKKD
ncbi:MAG: tRNA (guanosine(37)-N1)-methyltransferase TrmD [Deltaproteobacteria bacterium RBG_13_43_22]|nr:MAG: tRNA (guanosine(37)-N1)-methyltransferase TrmD [Deltaproteobacteria bacterium RBG_13_43_22]